MYLDGPTLTPVTRKQYIPLNGLLKSQTRGPFCHIGFFSMLYFRQVIMSQRYSWSGCRGLTEVTACSEDCRHRPELHSAAVMCSSLGRGRGCLGCCMIRCSHCSPGSMDCSNPWPAASSLPCHVWPPHHWPACQVSHR